jgi:hypothetical protein
MSSNSSSCIKSQISVSEVLRRNRNFYLNSWTLDIKSSTSGFELYTIFSSHLCFSLMLQNPQTSQRKASPPSQSAKIHCSIAYSVNYKMPSSQRQYIRRDSRIFCCRLIWLKFHPLPPRRHLQLR